MSSLNVRNILQDKNGFLWVGTQDGLNRFDGQQYTIYKKSEVLQKELVGSDISALAEDTVRHLLWTATFVDGINAISTVTGRTVFSLPSDADSMLSGKSIKTINVHGSYLLIGTNKGLFRLEIERGKITHIDLGELVTKVVVVKIFSDKRNNLWVLQRNGRVSLLDPVTMTVKQSFDVFAGNRTPNTDLQLWNFCFDADHNVLLAGSDGLYRASFAEGSYHVARLTMPAGIAGNEVRMCKMDRQGMIWMASNKGIIKWKPGDTMYYRVIENHSDGEKKWMESVYSLVLDNNDNVWLGSIDGLMFTENRPTAFKGFYKSAFSAESIEHAYTLFPLSADSLLVCTAYGLYGVNLQTGGIHSITKEAYYRYVFKTPAGELVVSNNHGLYILEKNHTMIPIHYRYPEFAGVGNIVASSHINIKDSIILIASANYKGIFVWDIKKHRIDNLHTQSRPLAIPENYINKVYEDTDKIFVLANASLTILDKTLTRKNEISVIDPVSKMRIGTFMDIKRIADGYLLASYDNGIIELNRDLSVKKKISQKEGLSNNGVYEILLVNDSLAFISTNIGLSLLNLKTYSIKNYYEEDGLHSSNFEMQSGTRINDFLFAGGMKGVTMINTKLLARAAVRPKVFFRNIVLEMQGRSLDTSNLAMEELHIPNSIIQTQIYFSGLNYQNPSRTQYAYRISELQKEWINQGNRNFISLIGLSPGKYHVYVKAANEDGVWSDEKMLLLVYEPKWFQTWLFKLAMVLAAALLLYALYRYRIRQILKVERIRQKLSSDLHDDIGSTLSSVNLFTKMAMQQPDNKEYLPQIKTGVQSAITGVRDIIWILDKQPETISDMFARVRSFAEPAVKTVGSELMVSIQDELTHHTLAGQEKRNVYLVVKEAVNNAVKYAECTEIRLQAERSGKEIIISVSDNGSGFSAAEGRSSAQDGGNGLKNMQLRCDEIKWKLSITSEKGKGSRIEMRKRGKS